MARWLVKNIAKYDIVTDDPNDDEGYARIFVKDKATQKYIPALKCHTSVIPFIGGKKEKLREAIELKLFRDL